MKRLIAPAVVLTHMVFANAAFGGCGPTPAEPYEAPRTRSLNQPESIPTMIGRDLLTEDGPSNRCIGPRGKTITITVPQEVEKMNGKYIVKFGGEQTTTNAPSVILNISPADLIPAEGDFKVSQTVTDKDAKTISNAGYVVLNSEGAEPNGTPEWFWKGNRGLGDGPKTW